MEAPVQMGKRVWVAKAGVGMNKQLPSGPWQALFQKAIKLIDNIHEYGIKDPHWTFGGGTVLMLRYQHRLSKDIDIFVP